MDYGSVESGPVENIERRPSGYAALVMCSLVVGSLAGFATVNFATKDDAFSPLASRHSALVGVEAQPLGVSSLSALLSEFDSFGSFVCDNTTFAYCGSASCTRRRHV